LKAFRFASARPFSVVVDPVTIITQLVEDKFFEGAARQNAKELLGFASVFFAK
jgi:hypothetical protein